MKMSLRHIGLLREFHDIAEENNVEKDCDTNDNQ